MHEGSVVKSKAAAHWGNSSSVLAVFVVYEHRSATRDEPKMPRRNSNNAYQGADCSNILAGFGDGPGARSAEYTKKIEVQPVVVPTVAPSPVPVCAWRHNPCHGDVVSGRDLCEYHLSEVRSRAASKRQRNG